jgi:integrase
VRGHIRKRARDSWSLVVDAGRDPDTGKRKQIWKTFHGNKKQAEAELARLVSAVETGTDLEPLRLSTAAFLERWLKAAKSRVGPRTHDRYSEVVRLHIVPNLGRIQLARLRPLQLESLYERLEASGLSRQTVLHVHRVLFTALRQAVRWQLVSRNVAEAVTPPRPTPPQIASFDVTDAAAVLQAVRGSDLAAATALALGTGMRRGEVLGLRWGDVDLDIGEVRVNQTLQATNEGLRFVPPKTQRSTRAIALPLFALDALREQRRVQGIRKLAAGTAWQALDLVFDRGDGGPLPPWSLSQRFRSAMSRAGIDLNFHGLRHAHASLMLTAGVQLKVVSDRLGHSTIGITADLYTHLTRAVDQQAATQLDDMLKGSPS